MEKTLVEYKNGNYNVRILIDGTKIRFTEEDEFIPIHPESIDIKLTNYCDMGCEYCHEVSTIIGEHADLGNLLKIIECLPAGVELACGGGNALAHPDLLPFLTHLKNKGIIANLTVNQGHLNKYQNLIKYLLENDLIKGLGISITSKNYTYIKPLLELTNNIVYHVIAGVNQIEVIDELIALGKCKVLILGYKQFGNGVSYYSETVKNCIADWKSKLPNYIQKCTISFDNLGIELLDVKRFFSDQEWERFYMGDDFRYTMYIDAVNQHYAPTSRSKERVSFCEMSLLEYFDTRYSVTV